MKDVILLEDLDIYQAALEIGECVWNIVDNANIFQKVLLEDNLLKPRIPLQLILQRVTDDISIRTENNFVITAEVH